MNIEVYTYVHIPTGNTVKLYHEFSDLLLSQKQVYIYGCPYTEWEKIKTETVPETNELLREIRIFYNQAISIY